MLSMWTEAGTRSTEESSEGGTPSSALQQVARELTLEKPLPRCCQQVHAATALLLGGTLRVLPGRFEAQVSFPVEQADHVARVIRLVARGHVAIRLVGDERDQRKLVVTGPAASLPLLGLQAQLGSSSLTLPVEAVLGKREHSVAAWRAALAVRGTLRDTSRGLEISVPCSTTGRALALAAAARRCGAHARVRVNADSFSVHVSGSVHGKALLRAIGVSDNALADLSSAVPPLRVDSLDSANARRARRAAQQTCARLSEALERLPRESVPEHLREAALLRLRYPEASMTELAERSADKVTSTVIAGRIRRLLEMAGKLECSRPAPGAPWGAYEAARSATERKHPSLPAGRSRVAG